MSKKKFFRFNVVYTSFAIFFLILSLKITYLQIYRQDFFKELSKKQHYGLFRVQGRRGKILDRNKDVLARSLNFYSVFADPFLISDEKEYARILSPKLNISKKRLINQLSRENRRFVWLKRKIDWNTKRKVENLNLTGIGFVREDQRFYPESDIFSSLLGLVDIDNKGLEGVELYYDDYLRGKEGWVRAAKDGHAQRLILTPSLVRLQKGADLVLSVDTRIQYWTKKYLRQQVKEFQAVGGSVLVMDASTGGILALANYSDSSLGLAEGNFGRNYAVVDAFEPGSVFKIITLAAALAEGQDFAKIYCEEGRMRIPGTVLRDWRPYGDLSFEEVFYKSSNIGVAKIAESIGHETIYQYIRDFGFGVRTGIDFPGETPGMLKTVRRWSRTSRYIIPIGQEIGVNLLQLANSFAIIANGGYLVTPHLAKKVCYQEGCHDLAFSRKKVLGRDAADKAKDVLIGVVTEGTGQRAKIKGEEIGGKTGTAQKFDVELGRYSPDKYRANFVGFISSTERPIVIAVTVDEPSVSHFGGVVAAPLFKKIAEKIVNYKINWELIE